MKLDLKFTENNKEFKLDFGQIQDLSDGGYERGYAAGYAEGNAEGYKKGHTEGLEDGKQKEWSDFWDILQEHGERKNWYLAFTAAEWTPDNFRPKYDIRPKVATYMFNLNKMNIDLAAHLDSLGVKLDFSRCTEGGSIFQNCKFTRVGVCDFTALNNVNNIFAWCYDLVTIDELILKDDGSQTLGQPFWHCVALENIKISGKAGKDFEIKNSPRLTDKSIQSVIDALADLTGKTSAKLTFHPTVKAKLTEEQLATIESKNWTLG